MQGGSDTPDDEAKSINDVLAGDPRPMATGQEGERAVDVRTLLLAGASRWPWPGFPHRRSRVARSSPCAHRGGWETWWRVDSAPGRLAGGASGSDRSRGLPRGLLREWSGASCRSRVRARSFRVRVIVVRLDPAQLEFRLVKPADGRVFAGRWSVDEAPDDALFAINAGQFTDNRSRGAGWCKTGRSGRHRAWDRWRRASWWTGSGAVRLVSPDSICAGSSPGARARVPVLSDAAGERRGDPDAARGRMGWGVDRHHRDARLALGMQRDGKVLVAMTRFEALGGVLANIPLGLTTPEMAAVMGALVCSSAVLLDGGISSQMLIRSGRGDGIVDGVAESGARAGGDGPSAVTGLNSSTKRTTRYPLAR